MAAVFLVAAVLPSVQRAARRASTARLLAFTSDMKPQHLNSPNNPRLKLAKRLHARRQREKTGLILLEGQRLIADALDAGLSADFVLVSDEQLRDGALDRLLARVPAEIAASTTAPLFRDVSDTTTPAGVLALFQKPILTLPPSPSLVLVCDSIGDPGNLGTLLRASAAAGVDGCLLMAGCADPWGPKALRAGMGAQFRVPMMQVDSWAGAAASLVEWGCAIRAADAGGTSAHYDCDWRDASALVVGSEAHGISREVLADPRVHSCSIPMAGDLESLNAAVAGAIVLHEAQRQRMTGAVTR